MRIRLSVLFAVALAIPPTTFANEAELEARVQALESRVQKLEQGQAPAAAAEATPSPPAPPAPPIPVPVPPKTADATTIDATFSSSARPDDSFMLSEDGSFTLKERGRAYSGTYKIRDNTLVLKRDGTPPVYGEYYGGSLVDPQGTRWTKVTQEK
jgi:hypothetical protein